MAEIRLYDTLTRRVRPFVPLDPAHVRMYVCGITPYDEPHIGNARVMVVFDVLFRLLRHVYGEAAITYASNFTDIDDKIINRARERDLAPTALAANVIESYEHSMRRLNVLQPTEQPRVSQYLGQIIRHIDALIAQEYAYVTTSGDVMYRAAKFPAFGYLARRDLAGQQEGARVAADSEKESPHDFVLWKANAKSSIKLEQAFNPADDGATYFNALGRPGWHIECSAMSEDLLATPFTQPGDTALFDIHGGGEDLQFPHHSCEIAQTEALHPHQQMCNYWLHVAFITVGGKRMGKSEGNFTTIKDALAKYSPEAIRLWFLQTHYRKPVDFTERALQAAESGLTGIRIVHIFDRNITPDSQTIDEFTLALGNDLNTSEALAYIHKRRNACMKIISENYQGTAGVEQMQPYQAAIFKCWEILGFSPPHWTFEEYLEKERVIDSLKVRELDLLNLRVAARQTKNWAESDRLRDELAALGILVEDHKDGTTTWRKT